jgi:peptide-methionine (S)-S-oxide reductase
LLEVFLSVAHDPTQLNRQGPDIGTQYRSVIFYASPEQQAQAKSFIDRLTVARSFSSPIVTRLVPLTQFYPAEKHHQNYLASHMDQPYIIINDLPKLEQLRKKFPSLYK